jgi:hypothetical protein
MVHVGCVVFMLLAAAATVYCVDFARPLIKQKVSSTWGAAVVLTVAPAAAFLVAFILLAIYIGISGPQVGEDVSERAGTLGAYLLMYAAGWLAFFGIAVFGPYLVYLGHGENTVQWLRHWSKTIDWMAVMVWVATSGNRSQGVRVLAIALCVLTQEIVSCLNWRI